MLVLVCVILFALVGWWGALVCGWVLACVSAQSLKPNLSTTSTHPGRQQTLGVAPHHERTPAACHPNVWCNDHVRPSDRPAPHVRGQHRSAVRVGRHLTRCTAINLEQIIKLLHMSSAPSVSQRCMTIHTACPHTRTSVDTSSSAKEICSRLSRTVTIGGLPVLNPIISTSAALPRRHRHNAKSDNQGFLKQANSSCGREVQSASTFPQPVALSWAAGHSRRGGGVLQLGERFNCNKAWV